MSLAFVKDSMPDIKEALLVAFSTSREELETSFSSGVNYSWTTNSDSNISGYFNNGVGSGLPSHQLTNNSNVSGNVTYTVTPYTNDCTGETTDFTFTVKAVVKDPPQNSSIQFNGLISVSSMIISNAAIGLPFKSFNGTAVYLKS